MLFLFWMDGCMDVCMYVFIRLTYSWDPIEVVITEHIDIVMMLSVCVLSSDNSD